MTRILSITEVVALLGLWVDEAAFELGPDVEVDIEQDHTFDAIDADHPDEVDHSFDAHGEILICLRCGNACDCCVC